MAKSKKNNPKQSLSQDPLWADRKTIDTLKNKEGHIVQLDAASCGISMKGNDTVLLPVNLPNDLKQPGINIRFSGQLKESGPAELWAAQPFVLSDVEKLN